MLRIGIPNWEAIPFRVFPHACRVWAAATADTMSVWRSPPGVYMEARRFRGLLCAVGGVAAFATLAGGRPAAARARAQPRRIVLALRLKWAAAEFAVCTFAKTAATARHITS